MKLTFSVYEARSDGTGKGPAQHAEVILRSDGVALYLPNGGTWFITFQNFLTAFAAAVAGVKEIYRD